MTTTEKYQFKVEVDQCGKSIPPHYVDSTEQSIIDVFEKEVLRLKTVDKPRYTMIEFGSNWAYYSLLFNHIIGRKQAFNIMVEPYLPHLERGQQNFKLNGCVGVWYNRGIGSVRDCGGAISTISPITIGEIMNDNNLSEIDLVHCDADGPEVQLLEDNRTLFENGKIGVIFLMTHDNNDGVQPKQLHNRCKEFFKDLDYTLVYEESEFPDIYTHTSDRVLVYRKK